MPELPEVESLRRILARSAVGRTIERARVAEVPRLRRKMAHDFAAGVGGRRIERLGRRAEYLIIELSDGAAMIVHLGMSGSLTDRGKDFETPNLPRHDHVEFRQRSTTAPAWSTTIRAASDSSGWSCAAGLRRPSWRGSAPSRSVLPSMRSTWRDGRGRRAAIKNLIMDQRVVAGIGNIYASEILFRAGVRPTRRAAKVTRKEIERSWLRPRRSCVLRSAAAAPPFAAIATRKGQPGRFADRLMVYGREDEPCRVCKSAIRNVIVGQRASFFCPQCQR